MRGVKLLCMQRGGPYKALSEHVEKTFLAPEGRHKYSPPRQPWGPPADSIPALEGRQNGSVAPPGLTLKACSHGLRRGLLPFAPPGLFQHAPKSKSVIYLVSK